MRYRLRTLMIVLALGPMVLVGIWTAYKTRPLPELYIGPLPPAVRPGLNIAGLVIMLLLPLIVVGARRIIYGPSTDNRP